MNIFLRERKNGTLFVIGVGVYVAGLFFLLMSLISYNATDSSWIYVVSDNPQIKNVCGPLGAHVAALLIYFFGKAAFLLCIPLLFGLYVYAREESFRQEWERFCASLYSVVVGAALYAVNHGDGGFIGVWCAQKLTYYFDTIGCTVF